MVEIHLMPVGGRGEQTTSAQPSLQESCTSALAALARLPVKQADSSS